MESQSTQTPSAPKSGNMMGLNAIIEKIEKAFSALFAKAPAMPKEAKDSLVQFIPWITLIFTIILIPTLIAIFRYSSITSRIAYEFGVGYGTFDVVLAVVIFLPSLVLQGLSVPGLLNKSKSKGWNLLFLGVLIGSIYSIVTLNVLALVGDLIFVYVLFQIRESYN
jgi:hypothetical protein